MWESRTEDPLGRLSTRKWLHAATALLAAVFVSLLFLTSPVGAVPDQPVDTPAQTTTTEITPATDEEDPSAETEPAASANSENPSSCKVDGVGWIVCSMSHWIADGVDYLYGILTNFFLFTPLTTAGDNNSIYQLWDAIRNFANVAFIIAFLIIIYGQMAGELLSNYTIKKLLPRVIVAAILVNTSFWICALGIDLSNILGVAVQDLFTGFREQLGAANTVDLPTWGDVTTSILSLTGLAIGTGAVLVATGGTAGGLAFLLLGALLPAIFAALVAVAILAARQALITLLVIIAPLAFVAYLLPNTEEWFTRWRKFFVTLLVMFPAFSFIFGASQVAGVIVIQNAKDISVALLGLTIQVVPLFITPFLIKLSSGLLGTIAGMANNRSKGLFDRAGNWAKANREMHRQRGFQKEPTRLDPQGRVRGLRPTTLAQRLNNRTLRREGLTQAYQAKAAAQFAQTRAGRQVHGRRKDAELRQHTADSVNQEAWMRSVYGDPVRGTSGSVHRKALHHQAHMASGRAKLIEDGATAHAERDFRDQVLATGGLRRLVATTHEQTKRAELAQGVVQAQAEARWNNISNTDVAVRNLKLNQHASSQTAKRAEEHWNSIIASINDSGGSAPNLRASEVNLANAIQQANQNIKVETERISSFQAIEQRAYAKAIDGSQSLQWYAGADTQDGATSAKAKASATITRANAEIIANIKEASDILPGETDKMADELVRAIASGNINSVRAHIDMLASAANPGIKDLRATLETQEGAIRANPDMLEVLRHHINGNADINAGAEDIATWSRVDNKTFQEVRKNPDTWSNVTAQTFATLKQSTQEEALKVPGAISPQTAYDIFTGPAKASLKPNIRADILALAQQIDPSLK